MCGHRVRVGFVPRMHEAGAANLGDARSAGKERTAIVAPGTSLVNANAQKLQCHLNGIYRVLMAWHGTVMQRHPQVA
jgi:hypothetical protein